MPIQAALETISEPLTKVLEAIFHEHYGLIFRTAYGVTSSSQDAEDIVQSLFLQILRLGFPPGLRENPKAYLYRAAVNLSLNCVKARRRQIHLESPEQLEASSHESESLPSSELQERLEHALTLLRPKAVEMLLLRYHHNYSDAEIGKLLGKSRGVIAVTLYRARVRLKKLLNAPKGMRHVQ